MDGVVEDLTIEDCLSRYAHEKVYYICVNERAARKIVKKAPRWIDLSHRHLLETSYQGLGIDREAACLGVEDGIVIDAGSAITVDVMEKGVHKGGWIWPGLRALRDAYARISTKLDCEIRSDLKLDGLPLETCDAVSFGILAPIVSLVRAFGQGKRIVLTGGDAEKIAAILPEAQIDREVVFRGMMKMIKDNETC